MYNRSRSKLIRERTQSTIDDQGNEEIKNSDITIQYPPEPPFIKLYLYDICYFRDMPRSYSNVMYSLLNRITYAGNDIGDPEYDKDNPQKGCGMIIYLNSEMKRNILVECDLMSIHTLDNILSKLTQGKMLIKIGRGTYRVNPNLFGKGDWKDIYKLRTVITYDNMGRTFQTTIERYNRNPIIKDPDNPENYTTLEEYHNGKV